MEETAWHLPSLAGTAACGNADYLKPAPHPQEADPAFQMQGKGSIAAKANGSAFSLLQEQGSEG